MNNTKTCCDKIPLQPIQSLFSPTPSQIANSVPSSYNSYTLGTISNNVEAQTFDWFDFPNEEKQYTPHEINDSIMAEIDQELHEFEWNTSDGTQNNTEITPKAHKKNKRKKPKKKNKQSLSESIGYDPNKALRAKGNIKISKEMTEQIIPLRIKQNIGNIYHWMDKWSALDVGNEYLDGKIRIFNYDFNDKVTDKILYCVAEKQDLFCRSSRGYQWIMRNILFTIDDIENYYKISIDQLPQSPRLRLKESTYKCTKQIDTNTVKQMFLKRDLNKTHWHKLGVYGRRNNKHRMVLYLSKPEFIQKVRLFMDCAKNVKLIPIMMFNANNNDCWREFVWIVRIGKDIDVGIGFKYYSKEQGYELKVSGIHLDKEYIQSQHELVSVEHSNCDCLDGFESNINDLAIGNPDDEKNRKKYYKQLSEKQTVELLQYRAQIQALQKELADKEKIISSLTVAHKKYFCLPNKQLLQSNYYKKDNLKAIF